MKPNPPSLKHELRTPLNHIIGFCEMLIEEAQDQAQDESPGRRLRVPDLERIHEAGRRLLGVINTLFDDSIPEAERLEESHIHHEVRTPLNQIIGYTELLQEEAADLNDQACVNDLAKIHTAALRLLDLVFANFGGQGFPGDAAERLDPHQPVSLLHREPEIPGVPETDDPARANHLGSILIADDDSANREMLARRLRRLGHTVSMAENGRQAVEMIRSQSFDLLLLDIVMPEMDGYEVLKYLQANRPASHLPVIVLSASDDSKKVARSIKLGAQDYLPKPFDPALLQARIGSCLEKKRLRDREAAYLKTIQYERDRSEDLLRVILPADIAAELKAKGEVRPRRVENVGVLFADVAGFTHYCDSRDPETVHCDLQSLVKELEILTAAHGMEKIKTIGDAFLAAAGLLRSSHESTLDCVRCGLAMIRAARSLPCEWELRIGVHCGPVVAGIVGRQKYQYDIWGDTVNTASRVQGEAPVGGLCVNFQTWCLIEHHCAGRSLGHRELKGKGAQELFQIESVRD
ncbi:MAG: response regulator [Akkermansiaceae bacterium]|nr:response regulator [Akkermansiaceae bacterium]